MLSYLVVLLDNTSTSFCHYETFFDEKKLIPHDSLKDVLFFAMKQNLNVQYVFPNYSMPTDYLELIESVENTKIIPVESPYWNSGDIVVINTVEHFNNSQLFAERNVVLRISFKDFIENTLLIANALNYIKRLTIVITDVAVLNEDISEQYQNQLMIIADKIAKLYSKRRWVEVNLLTDRLHLYSMHNCNAGVETITVAPDGKFYVCPAFYNVDVSEDYGIGKAKYDIGDLSEGVNIVNDYLYKLAHAPICKQCDSYHCRRCVWLNRQMTYELNTPSHQQCVMAHIERNVSRYLLNKLHLLGIFLDKNIPEVRYLDPICKLL